MFFSLRIALKSLTTHKMRTILAMLGVFLGALALTGVLHISLAMERKAVLETEKLGPNLLMAMSGNVRFRRGDIRTDAGNTKLKLPDAMALLRGLPSVVGGVPYLAFTSPIRAGDKKTMCQIVATWPAYPAIRGNHPQYGHFFDQDDEDDKALVCALGPTIATRLFGSPEAAVGQTVYIFRARLRVVGVMEEKGSDVSGTNQDEQIFVPLSTYMRRLSNKNYIHGVYMQLADGTDFEAAKATAQYILRRRHGIKTEKGQPDDFRVLTARDTMQLKQQALDLVQTLGYISSSLSFAIGGLGILSIMILLVRARRLEIGIRRAVGARRRDIIRQFLIESGAMSAVGGTAGTAAALLLLAVIYRLGQFPSVYNAWLIGTSLFGSAALGLVAGAYPAWSAANVEVLQVLRDE
ncbi:ABC transporter permease [Solidesulfovibrio sp. C21]|uniref:ABC transporter permease n=1 Tax=Solidesulfovibrio sp. C21 TaxID=3398613 RepID=UPI0039FCCDA0